MRKVIKKSLVLVGLMSVSPLILAKPVDLYVKSETLQVNGNNLSVYSVQQANGEEGYVGKEGSMFDVRLHNDTKTAISMHWHGLIDPYQQDGVPNVSAPALQPGETTHIKFPLKQAGTFWMHSHEGLQEAQLMSAPFIINPKTPDPAMKGVKDIVVMAEGITYKDPYKVLADLQNPAINGSQNAAKATKPDVFDVKSDAMLANRKTLSDPEVISVKAGQKVRLRLINSGSANNMYVELPKGMTGKVIAVDGEKTQPYYNNKFQLAIANMMDVMVTIPEAKSGVYPVFFQAEGRKIRSGIVLKVGNSKVPSYSQHAKTTTPAFTYTQYYNIHSYKNLAPKKVERTLAYTLEGDMKNYKWSMNKEYWPNVKPFFVKKGERVKVVLHNNSGMAHPMHLHGHILQLVSINGVKFNGFTGSTVEVLPHSTVTFEFDANNPGVWAFHCHLLYHLGTGMMTTINYSDIQPSKFYLDEIHMTQKQYDNLRKADISKKVESA